MTSHKRRGERGPSSQEHCHTKAISFLRNISTQKNRKRGGKKTHLIWMRLPRSLYIKSWLTPMWCRLRHRLRTELCHCRPGGQGGVAESPRWIWGRAQTLTLPRDGIFAGARKHHHQAGRVAAGRGGVEGWGPSEWPSLLAGRGRGSPNNTIWGCIRQCEQH